MTKSKLWIALLVCGALSLTLLAPAGVAQEKKSKPAAGAKQEQAMPPGCGMHGAGAAPGKMGSDPAGCAMMGGAPGAMGKGCGKGGAGMGCCAMAGGGGMCGGGAMGRGMGAGLCGPGMGCGFDLGFARLRALDLTAAQKAKLADIRDRWARQAIQKQAEVRLALLDLGSLVRAEKPDKPKIDAAIDKVARLRAELAKSCVGARLEARALLTPEQLGKWRESALEGDEAEGED